MAFRKNGQFCKKEVFMKENKSDFGGEEVSKDKYVREDMAGISENGIITNTMLEEEKKLEEEAIKEEQKLREEIAKQEKTMLEEQCYKRLHLLLSRSSVYANFMAEKLQRQDELIKKKEQRYRKIEENKKLKDVQLKENQKSTVLKRKTNSDEIESSKKKRKPTVDVIDIFRKENLGKNKFESVEVTSNNLYVKSRFVNEEDILSKHPKLFYGGTMRPYQIEGFEWLKTLYENGVNGILADEMGLGKTIQCIAFIAYLIEMGVPGPFIICAPLSTLPNWYSEFQRFTPDIPVMIYHGDKDERISMKKKILKKVQNSKVSCFHVVITTYQMALIDASKLSSIQWKLLAIDEAHRIKNFQCKLVKALKKFQCLHRLLLTGTPLQNDLAELWSLLNFVLPEIFDDLQVFESWFDISHLTEKGATQEIIARQQEKQIVSMIHQILTPFLLRRTKAEVELDLPNKKEITVNAPFTELQKKYYTSVLNKSIRKLVGQSEGIFKIDENLDRSKRSKKNLFTNCNENKMFSFDELIKSENIPKVEEKRSTCTHSESEFDKYFADVYINTRNISMCLRKICCHPYLLSYPLDERQQHKIDEDLVKSSGKLLVLDAMLHELKKRGHKVLIFSQFVSMICILEDYCSLRKYPYNCLIGSMGLEERQQEIKEFNESESSFLFLISTKAGGLGINLTAADTVIIYDSDWNPQGDIQAQDRCHRIGQTKPVVVYRLLIPKTVDENVIARASAKRKLEKVIIQKGRFSSKDSLIKSQTSITKEEMLELLESCDDINVVKADSDVLLPSELDKLLDRSDLVKD